MRMHLSGEFSFERMLLKLIIQVPQLIEKTSDENLWTTLMTRHEKYQVIPSLVDVTAKTNRPPLAIDKLAAVCVQRPATLIPYCWRKCPWFPSWLSSANILLYSSISTSPSTSALAS